MTFKEIVDFQKRILDSILENPENGFASFKAEWMKLTFEDKRLAAPLLIKYCMDKVNEPFDEKYKMDDYEYKIKTEKIALSAMYNFIDDEFRGRLDFGHLKFGPKIKPVDITAVFKLLYDLKYLDNTLSDIEQVIVRLFDLPDNTTISSYLADSQKIKGAAVEFKNAIAGSVLASE
ncbi:hypothetical protein KACHI17_10320 [Sediminibacterium sp. KACHI17]|uniref:DUF1836 domain-containing protein n=1 Tax=Sediminibacterium sp. KACHI17 TaxID=1751071 RepID=A0AAT9GHN9_9BACT